MFPYTKPELCDLLVKQHYLPQVKNIWCYCQDDGFGELVDTADWCLEDKTRTLYIINFIGYDSAYLEEGFCQYGDH